MNHPDNADTVAHQAKTLAWLTAEVDNLRDRVATLSQKQATISTDEGELRELKATNVALKAEVQQLRQEQERLQPLLNLLQGVQAAAPAVLPTQPGTSTAEIPTIDRTPSARPASTHMSAHMLGSRHNRVHEGESIADFVKIHR